MNKWTQLSIEYACQRSYLDDLFQVYPTILDGVLYIPGNNKINEAITETYSKIMIALMLRNYFYQI
ncbi:MAG: hypothetical protein LBM67_03085 [Lentimicrobiaceae bacterium]|jgi:hypothetical protein|nr:hypothetical protein [Lentimicrobiaceae bacterium]